MQTTTIDPLRCIIGHVLRFDLRAPAQTPDPVPAHRRHRAKPGRAESGVSDQDRTHIVWNQCPELLQEAFFRAGRSLLFPGNHHVQQGEGSLKIQVQHVI